jgi:hypothetical protein
MNDGPPKLSCWGNTSANPWYIFILDIMEKNNKKTKLDTYKKLILIYIEASNTQK